MTRHEPNTPIEAMRNTHHVQTHGRGELLVFLLLPKHFFGRERPDIADKS